MVITLQHDLVVAVAGVLIFLQQQAVQEQQGKEIPVGMVAQVLPVVAEVVGLMHLVQPALVERAVPGVRA